MATDWPAILPSLQADEAAGMTIRAIAAKYQLPPGSVGRWLFKSRAKAETVIQEAGVSPRQETPETVIQGQVTQDEVEQGEIGSASQSYNEDKPKTLRSVKAIKGASSDEEEAAPDEFIDKKAARRMMNRSIRGEVELDTQQSQMIKAALKDELEPEQEVNPYAGIPTDELALRIMTLAGSVLGLSRLSRVMRQESQGGMMDLGLDYVPSAEIASEVAVPTRAEVTRVETLEVEAATSEVAKAGPVQAFGVESLE